MNIPKDLVPFARKTLGLSPAEESRLTPFSERGSDRAYFRFQWSEERSAVLMHYNPVRPENAFFVDIARFLCSIDIPVSRILGHDPENCYVVLEDLGDTDLWTLRHLPWEKRRALYEKTLEIACRLHRHPEERFPNDRVRLAEPFGPRLYQWEREYFLENFVNRLCGINLESGLRQLLDAELKGLAERLAAFRCCLVHRDLQAPNVMVRGESPFLIDFQGMRFGTLFYDLGSLLCDPFVEIPGEGREELLRFYYRLSDEGIDWSSFRTAFWEASAERLMQALGAYGYLGLTRGLKSYLENVRPGLRNLCLAVENAGTLPHLAELAAGCKKKLE